MNNVEEQLLDVFSKEVVVSLTETKKGLLQLLEKADLDLEFKSEILKHIIHIDRSLISGVRETIPKGMYKSLKDRIKKLDKKIEEVQEEK